jgi:hypothetical protein
MTNYRSNLVYQAYWWFYSFGEARCYYLGESFVSCSLKERGADRVVFMVLYSAKAQYQNHVGGTLRCSDPSH